MSNIQYPNTDPSGTDVLKEFQLADLSVSEKSTPEFGKKISKKIWGYVIAGLGGYYYNRNQRFQKNRNFANGRIDVQQMFQDRFQFNGKQNYIRLVWNTLQIVNRIVSGLVGRWMQRNEKIVVQAIDDLSQKTKQEQYEEIEFILNNREKLAQLEQASGIPMMPKNEEIPSDKEELNLWKTQFQRIPEEIENELGCNDVLASNGFYDVMKEKLLHDSAEVGFVGTETWMDDQGVIHVDWVKPENAIYSATDYPDFRDTTWRGQVPDMKISELRRMYGKEFNPNNPNALTEEQIWQVAQTAKEYKTVTNLIWDNVWNTLFLRPYDEWNVRSMKFELRTVDKDPYTVTTSKLSGTTYTQKGVPVTASGKKREKPLDNQKIIDDSNINIYRGVYLPDNDILLEWGLKKNMIRPQDPKEIGNAEFSYSFYMYQSYLMRNLAIPEKIEAAVDGMILALLKIQQVVSRLVPTGWAVDETKLNDIDYGLADSNEPVDHAKQFFQTGLMYYKSIDAEGNKDTTPPIHELANSGFVHQMTGLINNYQFWYQTLKDELGEDPNLISAALQPRVTGGNVQASQQMAEYATDYMYRAYAECMKITSRKISCLLKDSIKYGAQAYRKIIKQDIGDRIFSTDIKFLPQEQEIAMFDAQLQKALDTTPELALFITPFQLMRVAKEDVKLAEQLFRQGQKKMLLWKQQTAAENQQATIDGQIKSAQAAEQAKGQNMQLELQMKGQQAQLQGTVDKEKIVLQMVSDLAKVMATPTAVGAEQKIEKGQLPPSLMELMELSIRNIAIPLAMNTANMVRGIAQNEQMEQENEALELQQQNQSQPQEMVA